MLTTNDCTMEFSEDELYNQLKNDGLTRQERGQLLSILLEQGNRFHHLNKEKFMILLKSLDEICNDTVMSPELIWKITALQRLLSPQTLEYTLPAWTNVAKSRIIHLIPNLNSEKLNNGILKEMESTICENLEQLPVDLLESLTMASHAKSPMTLTLLKRGISLQKNLSKELNLSKTQTPSKLDIWKSNPMEFDTQLLSLIESWENLWENVDDTLKTALMIDSDSFCPMVLRGFHLLVLSILQAMEEDLPFQKLLQLFQSLSQHSHGTRFYWNHRLNIPLSISLSPEDVLRLVTKHLTQAESNLYIQGNSTVFSQGYSTS